MKGSPIKPDIHEHIGLWFTTLQFEFNPQCPGHGSEHFWLMQALLEAHSELTVHSGLQPGGEPIKLDIQEQTLWPLTARHILLGPQGFGLQGVVISGTGSERDEKIKSIEYYTIML